MFSFESGIAGAILDLLPLSQAVKLLADGVSPQPPFDAGPFAWLVIVRLGTRGLRHPGADRVPAGALTVVPSNAPMPADQETDAGSNDRGDAPGIRAFAALPVSLQRALVAFLRALHIFSPSAGE